MSIISVAKMTASSNNKQQQPAQHVCVLYVATAGVQGPLMGSDEEEIVLLIYVIIDVLQNRVVGIQQYPVLPIVAEQLLHHQHNSSASSTSGVGGCDTLDSSLSSDRSTASPTLSQSITQTTVMASGTTTTSIASIINSVTSTINMCNTMSSGHNNMDGDNHGGDGESALVIADVNENNINILSEQLRDESILTDELIRSSGRRLEVVLDEFTQYCTSLNIDPHHPGFRLVTDGQLPIRQCLYPEAYRKDIELPFYYKSFYDLRKEVAQFCDSKGLSDDLPISVEEMLTCVQLKPEIENEFYKREAKDMVNIVQKLIREDHIFDAPESVTLVLEPGICSKDDEVDGNCIVRARGLPWQSSDQDIAKFFKGLNVAKGGVALCLSPMGRRNGEALVRFESQEHRDLALKRHKHHMGNRYIEVYRANGEDFLAVAGGASCEALAFLSRGAAVIIRMRGLPYDCVAKQVLDFFAAGENACTVLDGTDGVLFVRKQDGRATGDAFVLFANEFDAPKALSKHRESIGSRYIELFRSTTAEVQQVLNRSMDPKTFEQQFPAATACPVLQPLPQLPLLPQHVITSGTRKDCVRLRGLPYEALVEHILDFLGDHAKNIIFQGVHMVYNAQGQPSGEAFIQMDSEQSAFTTAHQKHHRYMVFGKKQRYIEVFQCSGDDMNLVLTGGIPAPITSPVKSSPGTAAALLSPGNGLITQSAFGHGPTVATVGGQFNTFGPPGGSAAPPGAHGSHNTGGGGPRVPSSHPPTAFYPHSIFYWPYPSPPVSPTGAYAYGAMPPPPPHGPPGAPVIQPAVMATALQHSHHHQTHQQLNEYFCRFPLTVYP